MPSHCVGLIFLYLLVKFVVVGVVAGGDGADAAVAFDDATVATFDVVVIAAAVVVAVVFVATFDYPRKCLIKQFFESQTNKQLDLDAL